MNRPSPPLPPQHRDPPTGAFPPCGHHVRSQPVSCLAGLRGHEEGWQQPRDGVCVPPAAGVADPLGRSPRESAVFKQGGGHRRGGGQASAPGGAEAVGHRPADGHRGHLHPHHRSAFPRQCCPVSGQSPHDHAMGWTEADASALSLALSHPALRARSDSGPLEGGSAPVWTAGLCLSGK